MTSHTSSLILLNLCFVGLHLVHAKATRGHALSHLIRYHYFLQLAAQMLQIYPPFGY